jgi:hypothetical protein
LNNWKFQEKLDCKAYGSGYPGDPKTKEFLNLYLDPVFGFVKLVRFSWSTAFNIIDKKCVQVKWFDNFELPVNDESSTGENEAKKSKKKQQSIKKPLATKSDGSILNFFQQKTAQKRNLSQNEPSTNTASQYLTSRKIKYCESF